MRHKQVQFIGNFTRDAGTRHSDSVDRVDRLAASDNAPCTPTGDGINTIGGGDG